MHKPALFLAVLLATGAAFAQQPPTTTSVPGAASLPAPATAIDSTSPLAPDLALRMKKLRQDQYMKNLRQETAQLVDLAQQLQEAAASTGPEVLSLDFMKKAQQAEDLAKKIRETMQQGAQ